MRREGSEVCLAKTREPPQPGEREGQKEPWAAGRGGKKIQLGSVHRGCVSVEVAGKLLVSITKEQRSL